MENNSKEEYYIHVDATKEDKQVAIDMNGNGMSLIWGITCVIRRLGKITNTPTSKITNRSYRRFLA